MRSTGLFLKSVREIQKHTDGQPRHMLNTNARGPHALDACAMSFMCKRCVASHGFSYYRAFAPKLPCSGLFKNEAAKRVPLIFLRKPQVDLSDPKP